MKKIEEKIAIARANTQNRIFDFLNSGGRGYGQSKVYVLFRGSSSKVYFVDKGGGGVKNRQKCVYVFYGRPLK